MMTRLRAVIWLSVVCAVLGGAGPLAAQPSEIRVPEAIPPDEDRPALNSDLGGIGQFGGELNEPGAPVNESRAATATAAPGLGGMDPFAAPPAEPAQIVIRMAEDAPEPWGYMLNQWGYIIKPGKKQTLPANVSWTLRYLQGDGRLMVLPLRAGVYEFRYTARGVQLFRL